jgi:hypothetical protein
MAVISIPTSIAGISTPGLSPNAPNGPLASLYNNNFQTNLYQYPRDLTSATKGHVVQFGIFDIQPSTATQSALSGVASGTNGLTSQVLTTGTNAVNAVSGVNPLSADGLKTIASAGETAANDLAPAINTFGQAVVNLGKNIGSAIGSIFTPQGVDFSAPINGNGTYISLYMPETVNFSYDVAYNTLNAKEVASSLPLVGNVMENIIRAVDNSATNVLLNKLGYAFNPQQQLLFKGIDFREYQMDFTFTPYSAQEAQTVNNIIKTFRRAAAPTLVTDTKGMFFVPPSVFDISFTFNGKPNPNINRLKRSVLTSINVDYAPNGWSAYVDGQPVQTKMTLKFQEMELVTRADIEGGY